MHPSPAAPLLNHQALSPQFAFTFPEVVFSKAPKQGQFCGLFKFFWKWVLLHSNGTDAPQKLSLHTLRLADLQAHRRALFTPSSPLRAQSTSESSVSASFEGNARFLTSTLCTGISKARYVKCLQKSDSENPLPLALVDTQKNVQLFPHP